MPLPLIPQVWGRMQMCMIALARAFLSLVVVLALIPEYGAAFTTAPSMLGSISQANKAAGALLPRARNMNTLNVGGRCLEVQGIVAAGITRRSVGLRMSDDASVAADVKIPTLEEIEEAANRIGMYFTITWLGPVYRCVIRMQPEEGEKRGKAIGFTTGSIIGSLIRQDTMRIQNVNSGNELSKKRPDEIADRGWTSPHVMGLGALLGAYPLRVAFDQGATTAQLLAICDDPKQFVILRRHYMRLGMKPIKELTEDISCVPDRMVWGGTGTLMEATVAGLLSRHYPMFQQLGKE